MAAKASLHSLPTEIKARIAELCRLQDSRFHSVFSLLKERARESTEPVNYNSAEDDSDHESCDDETDVFKMGPFSDRRAEDPDYPEPVSIFLFAIAPRYGHLVQDLDLEIWPFASSISNILASLAYLSQVRKVALPAIAYVSDLLVRTADGSNFPVAFATPAYVAGALQRVALRAETVSLDQDDLRNTLSIVRGTNLRTLKVMPTREDLPALFAAILACPNLHTLEVTTLSGKRSVFKNAASLPNLFHPTLRRLDISELSGGKGLCDFVEHFAPSLEELEIYLGNARVIPPDPGRINLPRLRRLKITGNLATTAPLVRHISPLTFPVLQTCTWELIRLFGQEKGPPLAAQVADTVGHLRDQHVGRAVPLRLTVDLNFERYRAALVSSLEALGIGTGVEQGQGGGGGLVVGFAPPPPIDYDPSDLPDLILTPKLCRTDDSKVSELGKVVRGSLDRIRNLADQAIAVGDRFQISRIARALQEGE